MPDGSLPRWSQLSCNDAPGLCIPAVLQQLPTPPDLVVIDGYVWLDDRDRMGLGGHLFESLGQAVPIIGVAKTRFAAATSAVEVFRGSRHWTYFA